MKRAVVVLNADFTVINVINWKRAVNLVISGKAEVVEDSKETIKNFEGTKAIVIPVIIKLVRYIKGIFRAKVAFSKKNVLIRDKHTCVYCTSKENPTIDHVVPTSKGGKTSWENCVCSCQKCNYLKGARTPEQAGLKLKFKPYQPTIIQYLQAKLDTFGADIFLRY